MAVRGEGEGLSASPAETYDCEFAVAGRQLLAVVGGCVQGIKDSGGIEAGDGLGDCVLAGETRWSRRRWGPCR
jgi:hypothetical protein